MTCYLRLFVLLPLLSFASCTDDDDPPAAAGSTSADPSTGAASEASTMPAATDESSGSPASPFDCVEPNFQPTPLAGPGIDPETGAIVGTPLQSYVLHSTLAVVTPETAEALTAVSNEVIAQAMAAEGIVGLSFSFDQTCGFARTLGVWESEEAMVTFVATGRHAEAMAQAPELFATGKFTHFDIDPAEIENAWTLALAKLETVEPVGGYE